MSSSISFANFSKISMCKYFKVLVANKNTQTANLTLPTFQGNMERIYPFAKRDGVKKGMLQNINFQVTTWPKAAFKLLKSAFSQRRCTAMQFRERNILFQLTPTLSCSNTLVLAWGTLQEVWTFNTVGTMTLRKKQVWLKTQ